MKTKSEILNPSILFLIPLLMVGCGFKEDRNLNAPSSGINSTPTPKPVIEKKLPPVPLKKIVQQNGDIKTTLLLFKENLDGIPNVTPLGNAQLWVKEVFHESQGNSMPSEKTITRADTDTFMTYLYDTKEDEMTLVATVNPEFAKKLDLKTISATTESFEYNAKQLCSEYLRKSLTKGDFVFMLDCDPNLNYCVFSRKHSLYDGLHNIKFPREEIEADKDYVCQSMAWQKQTITYPHTLSTDSLKIQINDENQNAKAKVGHLINFQNHIEIAL